jgi:hypothetical protein
MKTLLATLLVAACMAFGTKAILACGGMATIDPPSLQLEDGPSTPKIDSVIGELGHQTLVC